MDLPRIKPEHRPYRIADGALIRIGGVSFGVAAEVEDPTGAVWTLLESMDGTRSTDEVVARVVDTYPEESPAAVRGVIEQVIEAGYVEDVGAPAPAELTERDRVRYDRGRGYFRWVDLVPRDSTWEPQRLLRRASVTVVGVGGTGGIAAMALAASGVGRLHCVDRDVVELSNLNRQVLFTEADLGRAKVDAAVDRLGRLNSDIRLSGQRAEIRGADDIAALLPDCDVLLLAADQPLQVRDWTNRACLAAGTPWVYSGYHGPLVSVAAYRPGDGACFECLRAAERERHRALGAVPDEAGGDSPAVANAVAATTAGLSGHLAAHAVLSLITGAPPMPAGQIFGLNLVALDYRFVIDDPRRPDCPACAGR